MFDPSPKPIVVVATPMFGGKCDINYVVSLVTLLGTKPPISVAYRFALSSGDSLIPRGRNRMATEFLKSDATHLLFIDADIQFKPQDVYGLLQSGHKLVAAPYPAKELDAGKVVEAAKSGHPQPLRRGTRMVANTRGQGQEEGVNNCIRVHDLPTGFMMIHRSVLEDMVKAYPDMAYTDDGGDYGTLYDFFFTGIVEEDGVVHKDKDGKITLGRTKRYLSEDYGFCRRWQTMGGECWLYLGADLGHVGTFLYEHDLSEDVIPVPKDQAAQ